MFDAIDEQRILEMTTQEKRWLDNIKKAFHQSDLALQTGTPEDRCLEELFKAIDTAKTLRRSLRGEDVSFSENKKRFIEFLGLEIPMARPGGSEFELQEAESGELVKLTFGEIVYRVRCMVHENENLNAAENVDSPIRLDWSVRNPAYFVEVQGNRCILNGFTLWNLLREVLSKFITGIEAEITWVNEGSFSITSCPEIGSIRPESKKRPRLTHGRR